MNDILISIGRTCIAYVLIMIIITMMGKQISAQATYHSFAVSIMLGSIAANIAFDLKLNVWAMIGSFITLSLIAYLLFFLASKRRIFRRWITGRPTVVIEHGRILEQNMKKLRYTLDMLSQALRQKDIFDLQEVDYALIENDGKLSVLKKNTYQTVKRHDLSFFSPTSQQFPVELVMNGEIISKNTGETPYTEAWLYQELRKRGYELSDVHYAVVSTSGVLYIDTYNDHLSSPLDVE
ncbi:DUF421 domain-containing protein [Priestia koreensis]|uniref:DUF421 domain-containing protein n=1 Tax=Priestia koreensis TaxID=284581 RepID=UPI003457919E